MRVLLVIDMQKDFIDGTLGTKEAEAILPAVKRKIQEYRQKGDLVVFTADTHTPSYLQTTEGKHLPVVHCVKGTEGWCIHPTLIEEGDPVLCKETFGKLDLADHLLALAKGKNIDSLEAVGLCTDICVISNVLILKAALPDLPITVDGRCAAGVTPEKHAAALEVMRSCQVHVIE